MQDNNTVRDEVLIELNSSPVQSTMPPRPSKNASRSKWIKYCVALGCDPELPKNYSIKQLVELADRLGG